MEKNLAPLKSAYYQLIHGATVETLEDNPGHHEAILEAQYLRNGQAVSSLPYALAFIALFYISHLHFSHGPVCTIWFILAAGAICQRLWVSKSILANSGSMSNKELLRNENTLFVSGLIVQVAAGAGFWMMIPADGSEMLIFSYATMCAVYALGTAGTLVRCHYLPIYLLANLGPGVIYLALTQHYSSAVMFAYIAFMIVKSNGHYRLYIDRADAATIELAEKNESLKELVKEKKYLVDSVSHDLGQGINVINILTSNLRYIDDKKDMETCITDITTAVEQLNEEVKSLSLSNPERSEKSEPVPCGISQIVHSTVNSLKISAKSRDLNITAIADRKVMCLANRHMLHSTINNLVQNAVKYTDTGSVALRVVADDKRNEVTFTITDTGIGIPRNMIDRVFDQGFQVSADTVGAGMGLYTVRRNLISMGAKWEIESQVDIGTTVCFTLPLAGLGGAADIVERCKVEIEGARILVVDDNELSRNSLVGVFLDYGCIVAGVSTAAEASVLEGSDYDYAIIDYMLDDYNNGCEIARELKIPGDKVSIVSATADPNALDLISKEFNLQRKPLDARRLNSLLCRVEKSLNNHTTTLNKKTVETLKEPELSIEDSE